MTGKPASIADEIQRRRTFAIISHPDAGKTTLTEKMLFFGGAIQLAGEVKAKGDRRRTRSDWMDIEKQRGISVVTSVMTFDYQGIVYNLLDTPGHEDFSEDTYRTLSAVDSAIMVIDAAKGIEARTRKLFEVCRLRDIPIITFINKLDRESLHPFDLMEDIESSLALDLTPFNWPLGQGRSFAGLYDMRQSGLRRIDNAHGELERVNGPDDPKVGELVPEHERETVVEDLTLALEASKPFDQSSFDDGHLSPVMFGSALREFGVKDLIEALGQIAPRPQSLDADVRTIEPQEPKMTGFVFKIQANMDPNHRDRIAFLRVCSGQLSRGMKARLSRTGKTIGLHTPQFFFAQDRALVDAAFAGDVVGIPNHGTLLIGDTLTEGEVLSFQGVPSFAPEIVRRVRLADPMKAKKLKEAMQQLAEEGVTQVFTPVDGSPVLVGVVGALQLDVLKDRLMAEYRLPVDFEAARFELARWMVCDDPAEMRKFELRHRASLATDVDGSLVFLAASAFDLTYEAERFPSVSFLDVKDYQKEGLAA
ncbi:MAG: peptide chain release factor 3 [Pseudomonadota bacterium]